MDEMKLSLDATSKRFNREQRRAKRAFGYIGTAEGQALASRAIGRLSDFIKRELGHRELGHPVMPDGLVTVLCQLDPDIIALVGLAGLLNSIAERDRDDEDDDPRKYALWTTLAIGKELRFECLARKLLAGEGELKRDIERKAARISDRRRRKSFVEYWIEKRGYSSGDWSEERILDSGNWLLDCCLQALPDIFFIEPKFRAPDILKSALEAATAVADKVFRRRPTLVVSKKPLADWTDYRCGG
jgi:hypothetical protein